MKNKKLIIIILLILITIVIIWLYFMRDGGVNLLVEERNNPASRLIHPGDPNVKLFDFKMFANASSTEAVSNDYFIKLFKFSIDDASTFSDWNVKNVRLIDESGQELGRINSLHNKLFPVEFAVSAPANNSFQLLADIDNTPITSSSTLQVNLAYMEVENIMSHEDEPVYLNTANFPLLTPQSVLNGVEFFITP